MIKNEHIGKKRFWTLCCLKGWLAERLLLIAYLFFIALLLSSDNTKLTNNFFYLCIMLPAFFILARRQLLPTRPCLLLCCYLSYVALSTFWSNADPGDALKHLKYVIYILTFTAITQQVMTQPERLKWIAAWGLLIGLIVEAHSLYTLIASVGLEAWVRDFPRLDQLTGPLNAIHLPLAICLFGFILITSQFHNPWFASALVCLLIITIIPLQSRTPIFALLLAHCFYLFQLRALLALLVWLGILISGGIFLVLSIDRFTTEFVRVDIWLNVANSMLEQCSLLVGCGNRFNFDIHVDNFYYFNPHSIWLSQFFYGGVAGLLLIFLCAYSLFRKHHQLATHWPPVFLFCIIACFPIGHSLLTHPDFIWLLTWFPLALSGMLFRSADSINQAQQHHEADTNTPVSV
ncbi:O-antigen ligase family protein [Marinobacterium weihaiense]|uniref:O-antigen ligase n=1 Tax=Marinobacterium weihaiense TaxID=2851016 RepID=A0ABS6MAF0_9GAMM|nr:hypothetical protein [Marinobacterium weihaiense]MBV0933267.1 hypothetical protein [Marinobacterium weihaiense]